MKRFFLSVSLLALFVGSAHAEQWMVDKTHSLVGFTAKHMMVSNVRGEFTGYEATVDLDPAKPEIMTINATIEVNSISTRDTSRDKHLRSPDFFDVANHPIMTFASKKVTKAADGHLQVTGDLTIRGTTKEITLDVQGFNKVWVDPWGASRVGGTASAVINRKDFGLMWNKPLESGGVLVSDAITINLEIELMQKKS
jgi:polyisoprenoid-binding protein YceI